MANLYRSRGVTFNGVSVENKAGYMLVDAQKPEHAGIKYSTRFLQSREKTVYGKEGHEDIVIQIVVAVRFKDLEQRKERINALLNAWTETRGNLQFKGSSLHYIGEVFAEVTPDEDSFNTTLLTFNFVCSPFLYGDRQAITLKPTNAIMYDGYKIYPKFKVKGSAHISCNGYSFSINTGDEIITIDGENMIVYAGNEESISTSSNRLSLFEGDFLFLEKGQNNIVTVESGEAEIIYIPKYLHNR